MKSMAVNKYHVIYFKMIALEHYPYFVKQCDLPVHLSPSPVNPVLHSHVTWSPGMLVHMASLLQPPLFS